MNRNAHHVIWQAVLLGALFVSGEAVWGAATRPATRPASRPASAPAGAPAAATLDQCRTLYDKGDYAAAVAGYESLAASKPPPLAAALGLAQALAMEGRYDRALRALDALADAGAADAAWQVARADVLDTVGRYPEALAAAEKARQLRPTWAPAIFAHGWQLERVGRDKQAVEVYATMETVVAGEAYLKDAASLVALGKILDRHSVLTGKKASEQAQNILNNYFQRAYQEADKAYWPANVAAGLFLLSKHRPDLAVQEFQLAAKHNPRIPDVHAGLGVAALSEWNFERCLSCVGEALAINPNHTDAMLLKAVCLMQWRKYDQVKPVLEEVLKINPNHLEALGLMAAWHIRGGQEAAAEPFIDRAKTINAASIVVPTTIGEWLSAERQFAAAQRYLQQAVALAPAQAEPYAILGRLYMQTGEEDKAREALDKAYRLDDYRADVVNFVNLLKKLQTFQVRSTPHFEVKVDGEVDAILLDPVAEYCEKIYPEICGDFHHQPARKTIIEIFPSHSLFSVRITGKGWIGTVGASTGCVIVLTAPNRERSPQFGTFNWAAVIRHEFTHTVTLDATDNRIPHWFTEACAVWEQPDRRNYEATGALVQAVRTGKLFPIRELDWGFIRPRQNGDRHLAYAQSEWILEYLIATKGYPVIVKMLQAFREGKTQAQVFQERLGMAEPQFDKEFAAWARQQVAQWGFDPSPLPNLEKTLAEAKLKPGDAAAQGRLAVAYMNAGKTKEAQDAARVALKLDANDGSALRVLAHGLLMARKYDEAIEMAKRLEGVQSNSRHAPRVLAGCYLAKRAWADALAALELLKVRQPLDPYSYQQLAKLYVQLGKPEQALSNLIELHKRTMTDPIYARQAAELYRSMEKDDEALAWYRQVTQINPYEISAYQAMAAIHLKNQRYAPAGEAAQAMIRLQPKSAEAWCYKAIVLYRAGAAAHDKDKLAAAQEAAQKALELDPKSQAKDVLEMIQATLKNG